MGGRGPYPIKESDLLMQLYKSKLLERLKSIQLMPYWSDRAMELDFIISEIESGTFDIKEEQSHADK